jgi:S-adenosylmethionine decarboxylase
MKTLGGTHLIIDGLFEDNIIFNANSIVPIFDELVEALNMVYLTKPVISHVDLDTSKIYTEEDEGGISIYAQITTSHIALHVWPLRNVFCMDIFSCKDFDINVAGKLLWERLHIQKGVVWALKRNGFSNKPQMAESIKMTHQWKYFLV